MKKYTILLIISIASISFVAAQDTQLTAVENYVSDLRKIRDDCISGYNRYDQAMKAGNLSLAESELKAFQTLVNSSISKLNAIENYKGEIQYQKSVLRFLQYMQSMAFGDLMEIISMAKYRNPGSDDQKKVDEIYNNYTTEVGKRYENIAEAEKIFLGQFYISNEQQQFCEDLNKLLDHAISGYADLKGEVKSSSPVGDSYHSKFMPIHALAGRIEDWYFPQAIYIYYQERDLVAAQKFLNNLATWTNSCKLGWTRTEDIIPGSELTTTKTSTIKFIEKEEGKTGRGILIKLRKYLTGYEVDLIVNNYELK